DDSGPPSPFRTLARGRTSKLFQPGPVSLTGRPWAVVCGGTSRQHPASAGDELRATVPTLPPVCRSVQRGPLRSLRKSGRQITKAYKTSGCLQVGRYAVGVLAAEFPAVG